MKPNGINEFWLKVNKDGPVHPVLGQCWVWTASCDKDGYGFFWFKNKQIRAHRFSAKIVMELEVEGLMVLHKCDNPKCVNPSHLFVGTGLDNMQDMLQKGRGLTGRERSPESVQKSADGRRGKKWTQEMKANASVIHKLRMAANPVSAETRAKMSASRTGKVRSQEAKDKTAAKHRGMKRSEETKAKLREAWARRKAAKS